MKYYEVEAKCGHVGKMNCIWVQFAITAKNGKDAAAKARRMGRVKHDHKDAIRYVKEISSDVYVGLLQDNKADEYLNCYSKHEQNHIDIAGRIVVDEYNVNRYNKKKTRDVKYKLLKHKILEESLSAYCRTCY